MVFSKDAYSSHTQTRQMRNRGQEKARGRDLYRRLYLLIFFRVFLKGYVALVVAGRKNAQLFRLAQRLNLACGNLRLVDPQEHLSRNEGKENDGDALEFRGSTLGLLEGTRLTRFSHSKRRVFTRCEKSVKQNAPVRDFDYFVSAGRSNVSFISRQFHHFRVAKISTNFSHILH